MFQRCGVMLAASFLCMFIGGMAGMMLPGIWQFMGASVVAYGLMLFVFWKSRWADLSLDYLKSRPWAVLCYCVMAGVGCILPSAWMQEQMPELPNLAEGEFAVLMTNGWGYIVIGLFAPFVEEVVFRAGILGTLLGKPSAISHQPSAISQKPSPSSIGRTKAIVISALIFSFVHLNPAQAPHTFLAGLLLGWMYCRTGSIVPGIVFHWVNNTMAYGWAWFGPSYDANLIEIFDGNASMMHSAVVLSVLILVRAIYQLNRYA